jgi:hypothetical protein
VDFKTPEEELAEFLAAQPSWLRKILERDFNLSWDEGMAWNQAAEWWQDGGEKTQKEYENILRRIPDRWREYRKRLRQDALAHIPPEKPGRRRKDMLAEEAKQLQDAGKSYAQIAKALNSKRGAGTTTAEAIRKLLSSRRQRRSTPDKT